jgi:hypothetical protein
VIGVNRVRLATLSNERLADECRKLSTEWVARGHPTEEEMPQYMLLRFLELRRERERRGQQLTLF